VSRVVVLQIALDTEEEMLDSSLVTIPLQGFSWKTRASSRRRGTL